MAQSQSVPPCDVTFTWEGQTHTIRVDKPPATIGSDSTCDIVITAEGVLPKHAELRYSVMRGCWLIARIGRRDADDPDANAWQVNGKPFVSSPLKDADLITLGSVNLSFTLRSRQRIVGGSTRLAPAAAAPNASEAPTEIRRSSGRFETPLPSHRTRVRACESDSDDGPHSAPAALPRTPEPRPAPRRAGRAMSSKDPPSLDVPATDRGTFAAEEIADRDPVDCTVFAPSSVVPASSFMVQVFIHFPKDAVAAKQTATEFDEETSRRGVTSLGTRVVRGSALACELRVPDASVREPIREIVWQGRLTSVQFFVDVPQDFNRELLTGTLYVSQDSVPVGQVSFKVKASAAGSASRSPIGEARRYSQAFISYASKDRPEVLRRVQMLKSVGIDFFQDVLNLEPGQRWDQELYKHIDDSDVLFLFWSTAAKESEWVAKEWQYALAKKGDDFIRPVGIEGPPIPAPPEQLQHLHFGDPILYFMRPAASPGLLARAVGRLTGRQPT